MLFPSPMCVTCTNKQLRSVSSWSIGIKKTEASIVEAYIETISNAEHYIYIENQFFISQTKTHLDNEDIVKNRIAEALYRRIIRAFRNKQTFRVFILIPLLPAFEGEIGTSSGSAIQQITHYNYSTICKGHNSLLGKLRQEIDDISQFIGFFSLRSWDELNGRLVTELTYIHRYTSLKSMFFLRLTLYFLSVKFLLLTIACQLSVRPTSMTVRCLVRATQRWL